MKLLAEKRVVMEMRMELEQNEDSKIQDEVMITINNEMEYIRRVMSFEDILFELSAFQLKCDSLTYDEAVRALAFERLRVIPSVHAVESRETGNSTNTMEDDDMLGEIVNGVSSGLNEISKIIVRGKGGVKGVMKGGFSSIKKAASSYERGGYTSSEHEAIDMLSGKIPLSQEASKYISDDESWSSMENDLDRNNNSRRKQSTPRESRVKYVTDHINRDIWASYGEKVRKTLQPMFGVQGMDALRALLSTCVAFIRRLASWAGGTDLNPSQTLLITCSICILLRKGLLTFLANLVSIRLLRIAFIGTPDPALDNRSDHSNEANIAL